MIETYVGGGNGDGNLAVDATIDPRGLIAVGSSSAPDLYIADGRNDRVRRVDGATGLIETIAGNGVHGLRRRRRQRPERVALVAARRGP